MDDTATSPSTDDTFESWVALATRVRTFRSKALAYLSGFYNPEHHFFALGDPQASTTHVTSSVFCILELLNDPSLLEDFKLRVDSEVLDGVRSTLLSRETEVKSEKLPAYNIYTAPIYVVGLAALGRDMTDGKAVRALRKVIGAVEEDGSVRWSDKWEPSAFLTYWCWRAVRQAGPYVSGDVQTKCEAAERRIELWADRELHKQLALGMTHQSYFDPMHLGYALTICMARGEECPVSADVIDAAFQVLFANQSQDGVWPASGAIFPNHERGTVYVFAPEMLAVLLSEARAWVNSVMAVRCGLSRLVRWIEQNERRAQGAVDGWVSNHLPFRNPPESWSTVAVLGCLREIERLSRSIITEIVVAEYSGTVYRKRDRTAFDSLLDSDVELGDTTTTVKTVIREHLIEPCKRAGGVPKGGQKSMILFGPPGTAKTSYADAIAQALGWPLIPLRIGHFLAKGLPQASAQADEIFRRLLEAENVVVLFDEIEELVRDREDADEIENRLLTGNMLSLLQQLYQRGRGIYIVATNYASAFDPAVKRPGRFDIILKVLPPSRRAKLEYLLDRLEKERIDDSDTATAFVDHRFDKDLRQLTFVEWRNFVGHVIERIKGDGDNLSDALHEVLDGEFRNPLISPDELARYAEQSTLF